MKSADEFLGLLRGVKRSGENRWMALCPAHNDRTPSLSVTALPDKILVSCQAGCHINAVLAALKIEMSDLFFDSPKAKTSALEAYKEIVATYDYLNENGKLLHQTVRFEPKKFRQRRLGKNGKWIWNLRGITPVIYHLPRVKEAIQKGETIFLPEGEKDADNLISHLGIAATTSPMGAGNWREGYAQMLNGAKEVVVIADNDPKGRQHAQVIGASLLAVQVPTKLLEMPSPDIKDISDWISAGLTADQFNEVIDSLPPYEPPPTPIDGGAPAEFRLTDLGNAERLVHQFSDILRYCYERKLWLVWNGKVWEWDYGAKVMLLAKETARNILREAADENDDDQRKELIKHAMRSESEARLTAMVDLAQSEPGIPVQNSELNSNPWLFNCSNGTIALRTGELLPHNRGDLLTILSPVTYATHAPRTLWSSFLDRVTGGSKELSQYLQRAVGYSLTGDTRTQVVFFLFGLGNNGKSTFVGTIRKLMAGYGAKAPVDMFLARDKNTRGPREDLANLQGKRFIAASEVEVGRKLAVVIIKEMTGGENIRADRKYEHEIEFPPTHKLWISGNHKPVIVDTSLAIWRRIKLIPFTVTIPDKEVDEDLPFKLEAELSGILAWAVEGCLAWQQSGLTEPREVTAATLAYRSEEDILAEFIQDRCRLKVTGTVPKPNMTSRYKQWCEDTGNQPVAQKTFRTRLMERGITEGKSGGIRYWRGITLIDEGQLGQEGKGGQLGQEMPFFQESHIREDSLRKVPGNQSPAVPSVPTAAEKEELTENIPDYPQEACPACGADDFWLTKDGQYLCCCCHPEPEEVSLLTEEGK